MCIKLYIIIFPRGYFIPRIKVCFSFPSFFFLLRYIFVIFFPIFWEKISKRGRFSSSSGAIDKRTHLAANYEHLRATEAVTCCVAVGSIVRPVSLRLRTRRATTGPPALCFTAPKIESPPLWSKRDACTVRWLRAPRAKRVPSSSRATAQRYRSPLVVDADLSEKLWWVQRKDRDSAAAAGDRVACRIWLRFDSTAIVPFLVVWSLKLCDTWHASATMWFTQVEIYFIEIREIFNLIHIFYACIFFCRALYNLFTRYIVSSHSNFHTRQFLGYLRNNLYLSLISTMQEQKTIT